MDERPEEAPTPVPALDGAGSLESVAPIVLFVVLNRLAGLRLAVVGATLWSVRVVISRRRRGLGLGRFLPIVTAAVIGRGVIGVVTDSEDLYFGLGIATKFGVAVVLFGSILVGRPLAHTALCYVLNVEERHRDQPALRSAMTIVTAIGAVYYTISASFDVWLYRRSSVEGYVVLRFVVNWPLSVTALVLALMVMRRRLRGVEGLAPLQELLGTAPSAVRAPVSDDDGGVGDTDKD